MKAAKEKTFLLFLLIASALFAFTPLAASSTHHLALETRAELQPETGRNSVGPPPLSREIAPRYYDAFGQAAPGSSLAPKAGKPPIVGPIRQYDEASKARIPGYDNHHLDPKLGRVDPDYPKGPTIGVRNDNAGGRVPGGVNLHTAKGGFQTALNDHIKKDLGFTIKQWNALPDEVRKLHLRRYYASLGIPFPN